MDVPSWHPANAGSDALRGQQQAGAAAKRTEFTVMAGSNADTSTEEGRQLLDREESVTGGGRGLLDTSDRLYLLEQERLEQEAHDRERQEREAALRSFRLKALKVQHKAPEPPVEKQMKEKKKAVVIKAKKRTPPVAVKHKSKKPRKDSPPQSKTAPKPPAQVDGSAKKPATALLLQDYSSSSDGE